MQSHRTRVPDPEALFSPDEASLFSASSDDSSSIMTNTEFDPGDPTNQFDEWGSRQTLLTLFSGVLVITRMAYHLVAFTAGLFLASATFTTLAPLLDRSLAFAPIVLVLSVAALLLSPFWGLLLSFAIRRSILRSCSALIGIHEKEFEAHTRRCLLSMGAGLALASLRLLVAILTLVDTTAPCSEWSTTCAATSALALARQVAGVWSDIVADLATAIAVAFAPFAAVWFLSWRLKPDAPAPGAHYVFLALKAAVVALTLAQIWVTLSLGRQNKALHAELEACRNTTSRAGGTEGLVGAAAEHVVIAAEAVFGNLTK